MCSSFRGFRGSPLRSASLRSAPCACQALHHSKAEVALLVGDEVHYSQLLPGKMNEVIWPLSRLGWLERRDADISDDFLM